MSEVDDRREVLYARSAARGLASEFTTSFKPLLPELEENKAGAECAQRFIGLEKFFMDNAPAAQGFRRFYSVIIQARGAIMLDLSRAETRSKAWRL